MILSMVLVMESVGVWECGCQVQSCGVGEGWR